MSNLSAIPYITSPSAGTTGLWNQRYSIISANFAALNSELTLNSPSGNTFSILTNLETSGGAHFQFLSVGSTPPSYVTTAAITVEVNSAYSDYLYFIDSSAQKSSYVIGSRAGNLADGLNIWDASAGTMIASFSKQSIRFFQNVVGPVFDVGGALADTLNAATFGTGADSDESRIQAAISAATTATISRVYVPANMYPYSAGSISFSSRVQMVREGGNWGVYDFRAYGASGLGVRSDLSACQAAVDGAEFARGIAYGSAGSYVLGPSNGATPPVAGDYSLKLGDNVTMILDSAAIMIRRYMGGAAVNATIRNRNQSAGNSNIVLRGGQLTITDSSNTGKHLGFSLVTRLTITDTAFTNVSGDWNTIFSDCADMLISHLYMNSGTQIFNDGLHLNGCQRATITNCDITSIDDAIAIVQLDATRAMTDIAVSNCYLKSSSNAIKVLCESGTSLQIRRVVFSNIVASIGTNGANGNGITVASQSTTPEQIADVLISGVYMDCTNNAGSAVSIAGVQDVTFRDTLVYLPKSRGFDVSLTTNLVLDRCSVVSTRGAGVQGMLFDSSIAPRLISCSIVSASNVGIQIGSASSVTDFQMIGGLIETSAFDGLYFSLANGGMVEGVRLRENNGFQIKTNSSAVSGISVIGCDLRSVNGSGPVSDAGQNMTWAYNRGY